MSGTSEVKKLLSSKHVRDLPTPKGEVVIVTSKETPYDAFKKLIQSNVLSAPVLDLSTNKYTGFLDVRDLVSFSVFVYEDQTSDIPNNLEDILVHGSKLYKIPNDGLTVTYLSRRNTFHAVHNEDNLLTVCEILAKGGVHRVPVVNEKGEVVNILSQSSLVSFLNTNCSHLHELKSTLRLLNLGSKPVISVLKDVPAIEAFRLMDKKKISGVAVVDADGQLVGNTSASDLKLFLKTPSIDLLNMPIMQFLNKIRQESIDIMTPTITCSPDDSVILAIGKLSSTKVHRLFIADDAQGYKPVSCLSITDILRLIVNS